MKKQLALATVLAATCLSACKFQKECSPLYPEALRCEHMTDPTTIETTQPQLSWVNAVRDDAARGKRQTAYRIRVASSLKNLQKGKADVWDTGKVASDNSYLIPYTGATLQSGGDYYWDVMVWDEHDNASAWSKPAHWSMGLLDKDEWKASWITSPWDDHRAPLLRKTFEVSKKVAKAKAFVCGLGFFELYVNGQRVGDDYLVPNLTNYTYREGLERAFIAIDQDFRDYRVLYLSYDITKLLQRRQNAVGVVLGNGFYRADYLSTPNYAEKGVMICQLEITYTDGSKQLVCSDDSWKAKHSAIVSDNVYQGEVYDANQETKGWSTAACDDSSWSHAALAKAPTGKLTAHDSPTDKITEVIAPVSFSKVGQNKYRADFGKEISGWIRLRNIAGSKGDTVFIKYVSESPRNGADTYIMKGDGHESYAPRFTWHAFKEVEISAPCDLKAADLQAEAVNTDVPIDATFETSNRLLNTINDIWQRSQMDNMHGCISSDCPHRERLPYLGDGQNACITVMHNFDAAAFYQKWMRDMRDAQDINTGYVPNSAPWQTTAGGGVAWGAAMNIIPWEYYLHYGDARLLAENYPCMTEQLRYMQTWMTKDGTMFSQRGNANTGKLTPWLNLGDWCPPYEMPSDELVHTFYLWRCADLTARAAKALGKQADHERYTTLAKQVAEAFHRKFYDAQNHTYGDFGCNVFALVMGVPQTEKEQVVSSLRREIMETHGGHVHTGMYGFQFLLETLADNGLNDVAYEVMNKTDYPSFGHWIEQGATTTWEQWDGDNSHNHPMFGGGLVWFYRSLAGVKADEDAPAYKHFTVSPVLCKELTRVSYSKLTPYGRLSSEVNRDGDHQVQMNITVPVGSTATVVFPTSQAEGITESGKPLDDIGCLTIGNQGGHIAVNLTQGSYRFTVPLTE